MARRWAWLVVLLLGSLLAAIGIGLPAPDSLWLLAISGAMPVAAIIIGIRQYRPIRRGPWLAIGTGLALFWIGAAPGMAGIWERDALLTHI
jgi:hypothetical protein